MIIAEALLPVPAETSVNSLLSLAAAERRAAPSKIEARAATASLTPLSATVAAVVESARRWLGCVKTEGGGGAPRLAHSLVRANFRNHPPSLCPPKKRTQSAARAGASAKTTLLRGTRPRPHTATHNSAPNRLIAADMALGERGTGRRGGTREGDGVKQG